MPEKHPNTDRWGGPGASEENAKQPPAEERSFDAVHSKARHSQVSGGGGERDRRHAHDDKAKRVHQQNSARKQMKYD